MTNDKRQLQLLEQIEINTRYTAKAMFFFKNLTWVCIIFFLFGLFVFLIETLSK